MEMVVLRDIQIDIIRIKILNMYTRGYQYGLFQQANDMFNGLICELSRSLKLRVAFIHQN